MRNIKNPIFFWLLVIFSIVNIVDLATAFFVLDGETNPLFLLTNSLWVVFILKIFVLSILWVYCLRNIFPSNTIYFIFLLLTLLGIAVMILAIKSNIIGILNPEYVESANLLSAKEKASLYFEFIAFTFFIPFFFSILAFWFFDKSNSKIQINKAFYKERKWWKI